MTDKLLRCPFCGGEAEMQVIPDIDAYTVQCNECHTGIYRPLDNGQWVIYASPEYAAKAWNTRAERTCELMSHGGIGGHVPLFTCMSCDALFYGDARGDAPSYCPNCGARVVT